MQEAGKLSIQLMQRIQVIVTLTKNVGIRHLARLWLISLLEKWIEYMWIVDVMTDKNLDD